MLSALILVASSVVLASLLGHLVHWLLHKPWTGPFYRGHMEHHLDHYPPGHLTSDVYKVPKWHRSGPILFTPAFVIIVAVIGGLTWLLSWPVWTAFTVGATVLVFGLMNDAVHDAFHVERSWHHALPGFDRMRARHFLHHRNMRKNFGIMVYVWDRALGTLRDD